MPENVNVTILYEDNHVICAVKPRGVLSQADGTDAPDILTLLKKYIKTKYAKPGDVYLGLVHRLDRPVGGVMVVARTSKAAGRLSEQIRERAIKKAYYAVLDGAPEKASGLLEHRINKDRRVNIVSVSEIGATGKSGKEYAALEYEIIALAGQHALAHIDLLTGRPHQIRAQFAFIGHPVIGDRKYGGIVFGRHFARMNTEQAPNATGISNIGPITQYPALWAASLGFLHPVSHKPLVISAPPPYEYPWDLFEHKLYAKIT